MFGSCCWMEKVENNYYDGWEEERQEEKMDGKVCCGAEYMMIWAKKDYKEFFFWSISVLLENFMMVEKRYKNARFLKVDLESMLWCRIYNDLERRSVEKDSFCSINLLMNNIMMVVKRCKKRGVLMIEEERSFNDRWKKYVVMKISDN